MHYKTRALQKYDIDVKTNWINRDASIEGHELADKAAKKGAEIREKSNRI